MEQWWLFIGLNHKKAQIRAEHTVIYAYKVSKQMIGSCPKGMFKLLR